MAAISTPTSSALPLFWDLASNEEQKRISSSSHLVHGLVKQQSALASTSRWTLDPPQPASATAVNGSAVTTFQAVTDQQSQYVERKLDHTLASEVSYSLRRLLRGLASPRENSRIGFAVALTELLAHLTTINASDVLILITKHSTPSGKVSRTEQRNLLFARLFGIQALLRSGMLLQRPDADITEVKQVVELLNNLSQEKAWLRESCGWTLLQLLDSLSKSASQGLKDAASQVVFEDAISGNLTPEKLALLLKLQDVAPNLKAEGKIASLKRGGGDILSTANLPTIAKVLRNATPTEDKEDAAEAGRSGDDSGSHNPRVHFVWDVILQSFFGLAANQAHTSRAPFAEVYRLCVDESLFATTASPERKSWGFQVFTKALVAAPAAEKPLLFTPNFMRTWINQLAGKERLLHSAATSAAEIVIDVVKTTPRAGFALVAQLLGKHGSQNFDKLTKTKTIEALLSAMDGEGVKDYIAWVLDLIATSTDETKRKWGLDQLLSLVRNTAIPTDEASTEDVVQYLAAGGFFVWIKSPSPSAGLLPHQPKPSFSLETREICRSRFLSCLTELAERTTVLSAPLEGAKARRVQGVTSKGDLWVSKAWAMFSSLLKDTKTFAPAMSEDASGIAAQGSELLVKVRKFVKKEKSERLQAFELLVVASLLFALESPEEGAELVESLNDCFEKLFVQGRRSAAVKAAEGDDEEREPEGIELLQDYIIGLLEKPSAFLRAIAEQVFGAFAGEMTKESLDHLIDQLGLNEEPADDEEGSDAKEGMGSQAEDDEVESETSEDSIESVSIEEDDDEDVDEKLRSDVLEALKAGGIAHEESDENEDGDSDDEDDKDDQESVPDLTDEQMLAIDDKLADIFRQRLSSKKNDKEAKQEAVAFQNKILDLLAIYARKQASSPLIVRLVRPLFLLATGGDELHRQIANKASNILRNNLCKAKETPLSQGVEIIEEDLRAVHAFACRTTIAELAALANTVNLYLTRIVLGSNPSVAPIGLVKVYEETLEDFLGRNACQLKASFLVDAFKRFPSLGWPLRSLLVESCSPSASVKTYRQQQVMQMLQSLLTQSVQTQDRESLKAVEGFMPDVASLVFALLPSTSSLSSNGAATAAGSSPNAAKLKEVLKFALQSVRLTKRVVTSLSIAEIAEGDKEAAATKVTKSTWKPSKIREAMGSLERDERFKNSTSLQSLLKQMLVLVEGKDGGSGEGKKDKKDKKRKMLGTDVQVADEEIKMNGSIKESGKKAATAAGLERKKKARKSS